MRLTGIIAVVAAIAIGQVRDRSAEPVIRESALSGVVVDDLGAPIGRAVVTLEEAARSTRLVGATNPAGEFAFGGLPPGQYRVTTSLSGYLDGAYGRERALDPAPPLALAVRQQMSGLVVVMARGARISGRVVDEDRVPLMGLVVRAFTAIRQPAPRPPRLAVAASATTDRDGRYRLGGLPAGEYVVGTSRSMPPMALAQIDGGVERHVVFLSVYHPATVRVADAVRVAVKAGDDRNGIDVVMTPTPAAPVAGSVVVAGAAPGIVEIELRESGSTGVGYRASATGSAEFIVPAVPAGQYDVSAVATLIPTAMPPASRAAFDPNTPGVRMFFGTTTVVTDGVQPARVTVPTSPGGAMTIDLAFDAKTAALPPSTQPYFVSTLIGPADGPLTRTWSGGATINGRAGSMRLQNLPAGRYVISSALRRGPWAPKSALIDNREVLDVPFEVASGSEITASVVLTDALTDLGGLVRLSDGDPAVRASVVVFATDRKYWSTGSGRVRTTFADGSGTYRVTGLPPGEYFIAAIASPDPEVAWTEAGELEILARSATRVSLAAEERKVVALTAR
jgi:hypothetical protein